MYLQYKKLPKKEILLAIKNYLRGSTARQFRKIKNIALNEVVGLISQTFFFENKQ